jgi:hyperosmotically inducible protein
VKRVLLGLSCALVLSGCATFDPLDDTRIEQEVKARLVAQKDANLTRLDVVSNRGTVYLSGAVASADERDRAATLARGVRGVSRVVNTVEVRPATR